MSSIHKRVLQFILLSLVLVFSVPALSLSRANISKKWKYLGEATTEKYPIIKLLRHHIDNTRTWDFYSKHPREFERRNWLKPTKPRSDLFRSKHGSLIIIGTETHTKAYEDTIHNTCRGKDDHKYASHAFPFYRLDCLMKWYYTLTKEKRLSPLVPAISSLTLRKYFGYTINTPVLKEAHTIPEDSYMVVSEAGNYTENGVQKFYLDVLFAEIATHKHLHLFFINEDKDLLLDEDIDKDMEWYAFAQAYGFEHVAKAEERIHGVHALGKRTVLPEDENWFTKLVDWMSEDETEE